MSTLFLYPLQDQMHFKNTSKHLCQESSGPEQTSLGRTQQHHQEGREKQTGILSLFNQPQSSPSISCPPSHLGVIFKAVSVSSGMCWRGMHEKECGGWMGSATQTGANYVQKAHGYPGDG